MKPVTQYAALLINVAGGGGEPVLCVLIPKDQLDETGLQQIRDLAEYYCQTVQELDPTVVATIRGVAEVIEAMNGTEDCAPITDQAAT